MDSHDHHDDWRIGFCDDNSPHPGIPIVRDVLGDHFGRASCIRTEYTPEDKIQRGLAIGEIANMFIREIESDIIVTLCDDDRLVSTYIRDLCRFFESQPEVMYAWSRLHTVDPFTDERVYEDQLPVSFNAWEGTIDPTNKVDGSQVAFRTDCFTKHDIWYDDRSLQEVTNLDCSLFSKLHEKFGPAPFTGLTGQYKSIHQDQLIWHKTRLRDFYKERIQWGEVCLDML